MSPILFSISGKCHRRVPSSYRLRLVCLLTSRGTSMEKVVEKTGMVGASCKRFKNLTSPCNAAEH